MLSNVLDILKLVLDVLEVDSILTAFELSRGIFPLQWILTTCCCFSRCLFVEIFR